MQMKAAQADYTFRNEDTDTEIQQQRNAAYSWVTQENDMSCEGIQESMIRHKNLHNDTPDVISQKRDRCNKWWVCQQEVSYPGEEKTWLRRLYNWQHCHRSDLQCCIALLQSIMWGPLHLRKLWSQFIQSNYSAQRLEKSKEAGLCWEVIEV